jgi:hypothetical protein
MMTVFIKDQPEKFPDDERTIDWIGSMMEDYAAAWHIQWIRGTMVGTYPKSMTGNIAALKLRFDDAEAEDEAYADLERVRYVGCVRDMFTQIKVFNDQAKVTGAALKKIILDRLPMMMLDLMHTTDLNGKTDDEQIAIITKAGRTAERWEVTKQSLALRSYKKNDTKLQKSGSGFRSEDKKKRKRERSRKKDRKRPKKERKEFKKSRKGSVNLTGIDASAVKRWKAAGECLKCASPADIKGSHGVKTCVRPIKTDKGTASFPKPKEYQKMMVAAIKAREDSSDSEEESSDYEEFSDSQQEVSDSEEEVSSDDDDYFEDDEQPEEPEEKRNWWDPESDTE